MTASEVEPPEVPRRVLEWAIPPGSDGLAILGDLLEEFRERVAKDGVRAARVWYCCQALALAARLVANPDRPLRLMAQAVSDVRLSCRSMARVPGILAAIVLTIGLAVGANTALFSVFDGLLFRPLPYRDAARIVHMELDLSAWTSIRREARDRFLERVAATPSIVERTIANPATLFDPAGAAAIDWELRAYSLSPSAFELLGVHPILGRAFVEEDRTARYAVLLGHDLWRTRFGSDPTIVGRLIEIPSVAPDERWRVVGVMPPGFSFPDGANFWVSAYNEPQVADYARLATGVALEDVRAELPHLTITPVREHVRPDGAFALGLLVAATALMLIVAWVQVTALLFMRTTGRLAEIGVRLALGATRARLVRQFVVEGAVLAVLALGLAALTAPALTAWIVRALPVEMTMGQHLSPDVRTFTFAATLSAVGLVLLAVLPMDLIRRSSPQRLLRGGITGEPWVRATRVRTALFGGQLAIATALVYLTGLALQSFIRVADAPLGFEVSGLYAIRAPRGDDVFSGNSRARSKERRAAVNQTIESLRSLPGVKSVAGANAWPMRLDGLNAESLVSDADPDHSPLIGRRVSILPGYPAVLGVPLIAGDEPTTAQLAQIESENGQWLALANQTLARHLESFGPAIGQIIGGRWRIVGVMPDVVLERPDRPVAPTLFFYLPPIAAVNSVLVRLEEGLTVERLGLASVLERTWQKSAPRPFPVADAVRLATSEYRARTFLLGLVAILTIPLTMIGVTGALTFATKQRAREHAIELAMGADARRIRGRVVRQAMTAAGAASVMGLGLGVGVGRWMSTALFGVRAADPTAIVLSIALILLVAWGAAFIPAWRAGRLSPATVLRES